MENFGQTPTYPQRSIQRDYISCDLIHQVYKVLLTKEEGDHQIGRCSATNVWGGRCTSVTNHEDYESNQVRAKDNPERLSVVRKSDV